jgi:hypothetical protein
MYCGETRILTLYPQLDSDPHDLRATLFDFEKYAPTTGAKTKNIHTPLKYQ